MPYVLHAQVKMEFDLGCKMHRWGIIMAQQREREREGDETTRCLLSDPLRRVLRDAYPVVHRCVHGEAKGWREGGRGRGALQLALGSYHREEWVERAGRRVNVAVRTAYKPVLSPIPYYINGVRLRKSGPADGWMDGAREPTIRIPARSVELPSLPSSTY